jgi:hypothetical protein
MARTLISGNFAYVGGGVANSGGGTLTVTNSTVSGNEARIGGGLCNFGSATFTNSTVSGNSATNGGGAFNSIYGQLSFASSTVPGKTAASKGGGVYSSGLSGNLRSDVVFNRTLIAGNTAPQGAELYQYSGGVVTANNFNLFGHSGLTTAQALGGGGVILFGASDITATSNGNDPTALAEILNPSLANNGGCTRSLALPATSPAVDAVTNVDTCPPPNTDQRGVTRPQDGNRNGAAACDIGAYELTTTPTD